MPRRVRVKSVSAGWGPLKADVEVRESDRAVLHPLFVALRDRRAILYPAGAQSHQRYIVASVGEIRAELTDALAALGPDSAAAEWVERLRVACRKFLDAVGATREDAEPDPNLIAAASELRAVVRTVANHVSAVYRLSAAAALVDEMDHVDRAAELAAGVAVSAEAGAVTGFVGAPGLVLPGGLVGKLSASKLRERRGRSPGSPPPTRDT
jgi:hypothetical protein